MTDETRVTVRKWWRWGLVAGGLFALNPVIASFAFLFVLAVLPLASDNHEEK